MLKNLAKVLCSLAQQIAVALPRLIMEITVANSSHPIAYPLHNFLYYLHVIAIYFL